MSYDMRTMDPYRNRIDQPSSSGAENWRDEEFWIGWVWLGIGALMVATDARQPGPWGAAGSLGMLLSLLALTSLFRRTRT
jgi:hypothetical protein